jgi:hypothetical protein
MSKHSHHFVDVYQGFVGLGLDRETDERTIQYYLQKFSDDTLMENLLSKLRDDELEEIFLLLSRLLKTHLSESEYHLLFLKDGD